MGHLIPMVLELDICTTRKVYGQGHDRMYPPPKGEAEPGVVVVSGGDDGVSCSLHS